MVNNITLQQQANRRAAMQAENNRIEAFGNYLLQYEGFDEVARKGAGEKYYTLGHGHYGPDVKKGQTISRQDAGALLREDIEERIPKIQKLIPNFDSFPASAQTAIFGEFYRGSIGGSPKTVKLINEGKFKEASKEFLRNDEYRDRVKLKRPGIGPRMENVSKELMKMSK